MRPPPRPRKYRTETCEIAMSASAGTSITPFLSAQPTVMAARGGFVAPLSRRLPRQLGLSDVDARPALRFSREPLRQARPKNLARKCRCYDPPLLRQPADPILRFRGSRFHQMAPNGSIRLRVHPWQADTGFVDPPRRVRKFAPLILAMQLLYLYKDDEAELLDAGRESTAESQLPAQPGPSAPESVRRSACGK